MLFLRESDVSFRRLVWRQFPEWMRPGDAVLRYVLQREQRHQARLPRLLSRLILVLTIGGLLAISWIDYRLDSPMGMSEPGGSALFTVLYFPLVMGQFVVLLFALFNAASLVSSERERGTWEEFKITSHGAERMIRARWAAVFYQLRGALILLMVARVVFVGLMLADLTKYQGYHLDLYTTGITPEVSIEAAILLLAAMMTAGLLQLLVMVGLCAALGLWISALVQRRGLVPLVRLAILVIALMVFLVSIAGGARVLDRPAVYPAFVEDLPGQWGSLLVMALSGDHGLRFLDLDTFLRTWAEVDYGVLLGAALLAAVIVEIALVNVLIARAARRAARAARE